MIETVLLCLAVNVYWEARSEPLEGQKAVALVTLNRAERSGRPVCEEVFDYLQFSWANRKTHPKRRPSMEVLIRTSVPRDNPAWQEAQRIAKEVYTTYHLTENILKDAIYFHASWMKRFPKWAKEKIKLTKIGQHIFYAEAPNAETIWAEKPKFTPEPVPESVPTPEVTEEGTMFALDISPPKPEPVQLNLLAIPLLPDEEEVRVDTA